MFYICVQINASESESESKHIIRDLVYTFSVSLVKYGFLIEIIQVYNQIQCYEIDAKHPLDLIFG